jgi:hypothetical protein
MTTLVLFVLVAASALVAIVTLTYLYRRDQRDGRPEARTLDGDEKHRFRAAWQDIQQRFVDAPYEAVVDARLLVMRVVEDRGLHALAEVRVERRAETEELRQALLHYRALLEEALEREPGRAAGFFVQPRTA